MRNLWFRPLNSVVRNRDRDDALGPCCGNVTRSRSRSAAGDEDVFAVVVVERLPVEAIEDCLEPKPGESRGPSHSVGQRFVLVSSVEPGRDLMIERERVPHANRPPGRSDAATRSKVRRRSAQVGRCRRARNGQ